MSQLPNRYGRLIEAIFFKHYQAGTIQIEFERAELVSMAQDLGIRLPKNLGDVVYTFRYRHELPERIATTAPAGAEWIIRPAGRGRYHFALVAQSTITPSLLLAETKIPTPHRVSSCATRWATNRACWPRFVTTGCSTSSRG